MAKTHSHNTLNKYRQVIDEWFVNGFKGWIAYKKLHPNVKDTTASTNFGRIQQIPEIKEYILEKHEEAAKIVNATHEGILQELLNWLEADITETLLLTSEQIKKLPVAFRRLITKYKTNTKCFYNKKGELVRSEETIEVHLVSKERAIEILAKHLGFYEEDNKQKQPTIDLSGYTYEQLEKLANYD